MINNHPSFRAVAVTIACTNLAASEHFYQNILGATRDPRDGHGCRWYRLGTMTFSLMPNAVESTPAQFPRDPMLIFWLEVDDLQAAHRHLIAHGVTVLQLPDDQSLIIADPDGLPIEIWRKTQD